MVFGLESLTCASSDGPKVYEGWASARPVPRPERADTIVVRITALVRRRMGGSSNPNGLFVPTWTG
ncbi:hypothetical protein DCC79_13025 [bacterium]|nr:MAG: hypothetical protein DCC79_13025 [bacterium]